MNIITLLVFVSACALSDLMTGRIPNSLMGCGLLCALTARLSGFLLLIQVPEDLPHAAAAAIMDAAAGFLLPVLLLGILAALKMLGGADVKLLAVIGLQLGWKGSLAMVWYSLAAAAAVSAAVVIRRRNLAARLAVFMRYLANVMRGGRVLPYRDPGRGEDGSGDFCFGVPVLLALIVYLCAGTPA